MWARLNLGFLVCLLAAPVHLSAQTSPTPPPPASLAGSVPLPAPDALMREVERNEKHMEALRKDYTYHVHTDVQSLDKQGGVRKLQSEDAESLTIDGIRIDKIVAKNGKSLDGEEQRKEEQRVDKEIAKGKERRAKADAHSGSTDEHGNDEITLSRILELGSFSNPRRIDLAGRPTLQLDYNGNPEAKTRSAFETVFRDLTGTVWIDEADRIVVRGQGRFVRDFKLGGGLLVDLHKGTSFDFQAHHIAEGIWLPGTVDADGAARMFLLVNFRGHLHQITSDYKRFHASATIVGSHGAIDEGGQPLEKQPDGLPPQEQPVQPH